MNLLERAGRLHQEADELTLVLGLKDTLQPFGEIVATGSYYLDLMVYPDLDLYIPKASIPAIFTATGKIANDKDVVRVTFENEPHPGLEGGYFLNFRVNFGGWGRPWKLDIWWLDPDMIIEKMKIMHSFKHLLSPALREIILNYKFSLFTKDQRTPMYSGYYIYKAFLIEGLREPAEVTRYLIDHGINLSL
jgi:hypothetical protein